jgi:hypothetical protein
MYWVMNNPERNDLLQLVGSLGYPVLERLVAEEREELLRELEAADPSEPNKVLAAQAVLHGFSVGWNNILVRIESELAELKKSFERKPLDPEQVEIESITSPFGLEGTNV